MISFLVKLKYIHFLKKNVFRIMHQLLTMHRHTLEYYKTGGQCIQYMSLSVY